MSNLPLSTTTPSLLRSPLCTSPRGPGQSVAFPSESVERTLLSKTTAPITKGEADSTFCLCFRGRFPTSGDPLRTLLACAERRAEPQDTCHPVERSGKPLQPPSGCGHVGAVCAPTTESVARRSRTTRSRHGMCRKTVAARGRKRPLACHRRPT